MAEVTTTLENLVIRDVTARGELTKVYEVVADGRKFSTFKRPLAEKAAPLKGMLVTIEYTEKQKGDYTNYYLDDIRQATLDSLGLSAPTGATETPSQDTLGTQAAHNVILPTVSYTASPASPTQEKKDISIARAVALKAAVETATGLQLVEADSDSILRIANVYVGWLLSGESNPFADLIQAETPEPVDAKGELVKF